MGVRFGKPDPATLFGCFVGANENRAREAADKAKAELAADRKARKDRQVTLAADLAREALDRAAASTPEAQAAREAMIAREAAKLAEKLGGLDVAPRPPPVHHSQAAEIMDEDEDPIPRAAPADPARAAYCAAARARLEAMMRGEISATEGAP